MKTWSFAWAALASMVAITATQAGEGGAVPGIAKPARARPSDVPPYQPPELYRYPTPDVVEEVRATDPKPWPAPAKPVFAQRKAASSEEPPLPKAAPQHKVEILPLPPAIQGNPVEPPEPDTTKL